MRAALSRLPLDVVVPALFSLTVVVFVLASGSITTLVQIAGPARWVCLLLLGTAGAAWALTGSPRFPSLYATLLALLAALALASVSWSVSPLATAADAVALGGLLALTGAVALGASADPRRPVLLLAAFVGTVAAVCAAGFLLVAVDRSLGVQGGLGWRVQGLGQNPNTVPLLVSLAVPVSLWLLLEWQGRRRLAVGAGLALLYATLLTSQSRGAQAASLAGCLVVLALVRRRWAVRAAAAAAAAALLVIAVEVRSAADRSATAEATPAPYQPPFDTRVKPGAVQQPVFLPVGREYELGNPLLPGPAQNGRLAVWETALAQANLRPLLGYGFGTEEKVFVERSWFFTGDYVENSYLGLYLQLGLLGLGTLVLAGLTPLRGVSRAPAAAGAAGAAAAGFAGACFQSYVYAPGNVAAGSFWIVLGLAAALAAPPRLPRGSAVLRASAVVAAAALASVPLGIWQADRGLDRVLDRIDGVRTAVGTRLDEPTLTAYRASRPGLEIGPFRCLVYSRGDVRFALELCYDRAGRLVEAIDRRGGETRFHEVNAEPEQARVRVPPEELANLFHRLGSP